MLKGALAIIAGFVGMVVIVMATQPILVRVFLPEAVPDRLTRAYLAANLSCAFIAAVLAGIVCAKLAPEPRTRYVLVLSALVLALSLVSAVTDHQHPSCYFGVIGVLAAGGVLFGRYLVSGS